MTSGNPRHPRPRGDSWSLGALRKSKLISTACAATLAFGGLVGIAPAATAAEGTVSGNAFEDANANGAKDGAETGIPGISVEAFNAAGESIGTGTTSDDGSYTISYDTADESTSIRLEFGSKSGYLPGPVGEGAGSTVQFVENGATANIGFIRPGQVIAENPDLYWAEAHGAATGVNTRTDPTTQRSIGTLPYETRGVQNNATALATQDQTGSIWGLGELGGTHILSAAQFKRYVTDGPGGLGAIYLSDAKAGAPNAAPFVTIPNAGENPRPDGASAVDSTYDWFRDLPANPLVGKIGLGGLAVSDTNDAFYVVNLNDKNLYKVALTKGGSTWTPGEPAAMPLPTDLPGASISCDTENVRPFGVHFDQDSLWVTLTCTGPAADNLRGFVYQLDLDGNVIGDGPAVEIPMDHQRGISMSLAWNTSANWLPWTDEQRPNAGWNTQPQPFVSDVDFDSNGDMSIAVKDRYGDQSGYNTGYQENSLGLQTGAGAGDVLRACVADGAFTLESNGACGANTGYGPGNNQGNGGGEFYSDDFGGLHQQVALGALLQVPGFPDVVGTTYDPGTADYSQGFRFWSNENGIHNAANGWTSVNRINAGGGAGGMGKAAGLGDLDVLAETAVELGNRVWIDSNNNGLQDAGEAAVEGVTVTLTCGDITAETTTNAAGEYYFNNSNVEAGLPELTDCTLTFDVAGTSAEGLELTTVNVEENGRDNIDSDAEIVDGNIQIAVTTPGDGANHTYDVGFVPEAEVCSIGDYVWNDANNNGLQDEGEAPVAGVTVTLLNSDGTPVEGVATVTTDAEGKYLFSEIECGTYRVQFSDIPEGSEFTTPNAEDNGQEATDSDATPKEDDPTVGVTDEFTVGGEQPNDRTDVDAGVVTPVPAEVCSIGDYVWNDANNNGLQDEGEAPVAGVTVTLLNSDGTPVEGVATVTTDAEGKYLFSEIECGTYRVQFSDIPEGSEFTTPNAEDNGQEATDSDATPKEDDPTVGVTDEFPVGGEQPNDRTDVDAGVVTPVPAEVCSIGDYVWYDLDKDGVQDEGEAGAEGVTVALVNADGETVTTVETDANGKYLFSEIDCGTYTVTFEQPEGYDFTTTGEGDDPTSDSDPTEDGVVEGVTVGGEEPNDRTDIDAGLVQPVVPVEKCTIGDFVWFDADKDGIQDAGEDAVPGVSVTLLDAEGNPVTGVPVLTTDAEGKYLFENLDCGTYRVQFENLPEGTEFTTPTAGNDPKVDSNANKDGITNTVTVGGEQENENLTLDAGIVETEVLPEPEKCRIGDFVWYDLNENGVQDSSELGVEGVTVTLIDADGKTVDTKTTSVSGGYVFDEIECGTYRIQFSDIPEGTTFTTPEQGTDPAKDSNPDSDGLTKDIIVGEEEPNEDLTIDAGIVPPAPVEVCSVGDFVWLDQNGNGIQDKDEAGVAGVTVTLLDAKGNPTGIAPVVTDENGKYVFEGIECGTYRIQFSTTPEGYDFTTPGEGNDPTEDSNPNNKGITPVFEVGGEEPNDREDIDAGLVPPAPVEVCSVGDFVWNDKNANGIQDSDEVGVEGVVVTLIDVDGKEVAEVKTDKDGKYIFEGIDCGTYQIKVSDLPEGYTFTPPGEGDDPTKDSDPNEDGVTPKFPVGGEDPKDRTDIDTGIVPPAPVEVCSIGDFVWQDMNGDGIQNDVKDEQGAADVTVILIDADGKEVAKVKTDENGKYVFEGIDCGTYTVKFVVPEGDTVSPQGEGDDPTKDSDPNKDGIVEKVTVGGEEPNDREDIDLGLVPNEMEVCSIGDFVFNDTNKNGIQDKDEKGVENVTVTLLDHNGNEVSKVKTDENGKYLFSTLECGETYTVKFSDLPEGYSVSPQGEGDDPSKDSDPNKDGIVEDVTVGGEEPNDRTDIDAGIYPPSEKCLIGDRVWIDENKNGIQDKGEEGVEGVTVTLVDADGKEVTSVKTDKDGKYVLEGIDCGTYTVKFTELPDGYLFTAPNEGNDPTKDSDPNKDGIVEKVIVGGEQPDERKDIDAGIVKPSPQCLIGDLVWNDKNQNGIQDKGEEGVEGVTVTLVDADGKEVTSVKTDKDGKYVFEGIDCGTYTVKFSGLPDGFVISPQGEGDSRAKDSDANSNGVVENVKVGEGDPTDRLDIDLGISKPVAPAPKPEDPQKPKPETPRLSDTGLTAGVVGAGVLGLLLAGAGVVLMRRRKNS